MDVRSLREAPTEAEQMINPARQPVILADVEAHRFRFAGPTSQARAQDQYGTERHMQDDLESDVWPWQYRRLPEILGVGHGFVVDGRARAGPPRRPPSQAVMSG